MPDFHKPTDDERCEHMVPEPPHGYHAHRCNYHHKLTIRLIEDHEFKKRVCGVHLKSYPLTQWEIDR